MKTSQDFFYFFSSLDSWLSLWWKIFEVAIGIYSSRRQLHSVIRSFTAALDWKCNTESVSKSETENWDMGNLCHLHTLSQHMAVSVEANSSHF